MGKIDIQTIEMHTGGEPLRIVVHGYPECEGRTILEIRDELKSKHDYLRKLIMWEPRGHADMYGLLKVPAERPDSDFGVIFMHNAGYSTMCGHATIAITRAAIDHGWVDKVEPITTVKIDAPCGQLTAFATVESGEVVNVSFENVPSFFVDSYVVRTSSYGDIDYDLAYGGAFYAYVNVDQVGLKCSPADYSELIMAGKEIKQAVIDHNSHIIHPFEQELSFLYGVIFIDPRPYSDVHSRNVCVFADGEVDRCSTGSGVSGRAAIHYAKAQLRIGETIKIQSIIDTNLTVSIKEEVDYGPHNAIVPTVSGMAYYTGENKFTLEQNDPIQSGFILR